MKKYGTFFLLVIFFLVISCENNNKTKNDITYDSMPSEVSSKREDSAALKLPDNKSDSVIANKNTQSFLNGGNLKTDDYIKQYPANQNAQLRRHIEWLRKEWQNVPNPITATYQGNDFGDYHHILFKDANGVEYDFGQAKNNYGQYNLHELSGQYDDNPEFLGKKFKVSWDWKLSEFLCCDGEYGEAKAYLPSITKLELIKN
jgi:hypothetical protein